MLCGFLEAQTCAKLLISGYPNQKVSEPESYITQIIAVFTQYERDLVRRACAPAGIPFEFSTYLPSVGEVNKWLAEKSVKARGVYPRLPRLPEPERKSRPTYEELQRRCAEAGLEIGKKPRRQSTEKEIEGFRAKHGITDEQWAALPDAPLPWAPLPNVPLPKEEV